MSHNGCDGGIRLGTERNYARVSWRRSIFRHFPFNRVFEYELFFRWHFAIGVLEYNDWNSFELLLYRVRRNRIRVHQWLFLIVSLINDITNNIGPILTRIGHAGPAVFSRIRFSTIFWLETRTRSIILRNGSRAYANACLDFIKYNFIFTSH